MTAALLMVAAGIGLLLVHWLSVGLALWHLRRPLPPALAPAPRITVLRPVCGLDPFVAETLGSGFRLSPAPAEMIFCAARADDPVVPLVRSLIAAHPQVPARLLIGDERISGNPKLNNLVKGWQDARSDWIVMADSNLLLPADYLATLAACWGPGTGLVTSPACGAQPEGLWARVECATLNGFQARLQLAASALGFGFAQGKTLFWNRRILNRAGGLSRLGQDLAEDVAATKVVRGEGLRVRLAPRPFAQPIGRRQLRAVWDRQLRWSRLRRAGFPRLFWLEPLNGAGLPMLLLTGAAATGAVSALWPVLLPLGWYGAEALLARRAGWPMGPGDLLAAVLRDLALPVLWAATFVPGDLVWRDTALSDRTPMPQ